MRCKTEMLLRINWLNVWHTARQTHGPTATLMYWVNNQPIDTLTDCVTDPLTDLPTYSRHTITMTDPPTDLLTGISSQWLTHLLTYSRHNITTDSPTDLLKAYHHNDWLTYRPTHRHTITVTDPPTNLLKGIPSQWLTHLPTYSQEYHHNDW
jgi:hypothetical protein